MGKITSTKKVIKKAADEVADDLLRLLGDRYPKTGLGEAKVDAKTGKAFVGKAKTDEELALEAARSRVNRDVIKTGDYEPYFPVDDRYYADPLGYELAGNTLDDAVPKKQATYDKHYKNFNTEVIKNKVRDAYQSGYSDLSKDWYAMGQLESAFIDELGEEAGRIAFKERFADAMAATTGKSDPGSNLLQAAYANFRKTNDIPTPRGSPDIPTPVGGLSARANQEHFDNWLRNGGAMSAAEHPKRFNFSANFLGDIERLTLDEQMTTPLLGKNAPSKIEYGVLERVLGDVAREMGIAPANLQDVVWAGFKKNKVPTYEGKPMIQWVNESLARTAEVTGKSQGDVLKGFIRGTGPLYGAGGAAILGAGSEDAEAGPVSAVKKFGKVLRGIHYSKVDDPIRHLDGSKYGTGAKGAEAGRVSAGPDDLKDRTFFYVEGSRPQAGRATPRPESGVGSGPTYQVKLSGMYDTKENPLGLTSSNLESELKKNGFTGYYNPENGMAVALQPETEAVRLAGNRGQAEEALKRADRIDSPYMVTAENLPSTETEFGSWLSRQPLDVRERYTDQVEVILDKNRLMKELGIEDYLITPGYGSYMGEVNPNTVVMVNSADDAKLLADTRGFVTEQDAVPFFKRGDVGPVGVRVELPDGISPVTLDEIYAGTGQDFTRTNLDALDFINYTDDKGIPYSGIDDQQFSQLLGEYFNKIGDSESVKSYRSVGEYNETKGIWSSPNGTAGPLKARPRLVELKERIKEYNRAFQSQHGGVDPRILPIMASLTAALGYATEAKSQVDQAATKFMQKRNEKRQYWAARRQDLLDTANFIAENVMLAVDKPLQGYLGLAGVAGGLVAGQGMDQALQQGAQNARRPVEQTTFGLGAAAQDQVQGTPLEPLGPAIGTAVHSGLLMGSPL